jgi:hypothetical protein
MSEDIQQAGRSPCGAAYLRGVTESYAIELDPEVDEFTREFREEP